MGLRSSPQLKESSMSQRIGNGLKSGLGTEAQPVETKLDTETVLEELEFPRRAWADPSALVTAIGEAKTLLLENHGVNWTADVNQPPIVARYGAPAPVDPRDNCPTEPEVPPNAMRYGLPMPTDSAEGMPDLPPIAARYGTPAPVEPEPREGCATPEQPPIAMRYGLPMPTDR
jgi:hypothetical protein